jgi:hypothetical protein
VPVRRNEFEELLNATEQNSDEVCLWAATPPYLVINGQITPRNGLNPRVAAPLSNPDLFLSLARLGARGEPSERSILGWVGAHGLLKGRDRLRESGRLRTGPYIKPEERIVQYPLAVGEFRKEVRCANQLLRLYADFRSGNHDAVAGWFLGPWTPRGEVENTIVDQYIAEWRSRPRNDMRTWMADHAVTTFEQAGELLNGVARTILIDSLFFVVKDVRLSLTDLPILGDEERGWPLTIRRSVRCPDLLSAVYLQFYLMVSDSKAMRRCEACGTPFPAKPKNKWHCNSTCRSNARHERRRGF